MNKYAKEKLPFSYVSKEVFPWLLFLERKLHKKALGNWGKNMICLRLTDVFLLFYSKSRDSHNQGQQKSETVTDIE